MSWAAHEFENYFLQKHVGVKASFFGLALGALAPDLFTKFFVYESSDPAHFHRGWPGVGFTHSFLFGVVLAVLVLAATKSRGWALGILIGHWAHVLTDVADTAGVMPFFPFSTDNVSISMWKHAAAQGRYGDAAAYYSSLGGVWDFFWFVVVILFARKALSSEYFRTTVVVADPKVWAWLHNRLGLNQRGLLLVYRGFFFYGLGRMVSWFLYARFEARTPFQPTWGGPDYLSQGNDLSDSSFLTALWHTTAGGVAFFVCMWILWRLFIGRLWDRAEDAPAVQRGPGIAAVFD